MIGVVVMLAVAGAVAGLRLKSDAGTDTLVDRGSPAFAATEDFRQKFGDDAAVVLVRENLRRLLLTKDLEPLFELETCLAGGTSVGANLPRRQNKPLPEVCDRIAELAPSRVVFGPATFLYQSVAQIQQVLSGQIRGAVGAAQLAARRAQRQAAERGLSVAEQRQAAAAAGRQVLQSFQGNLLGLALRYRITSLPRIDDPAFVSRVVFDSRRPVGTPKARFAYLFPSRASALISMRLRPDLTDDERHEAIGLFRQAASDPRFQLSAGDYVVSGAPAVVDGLSHAIRSQLLLLLAVAVAVMALALMLVLRPPLRLLPLGVALASTALLFGLVSLLGGSLTIAAIAMLPVLIGLAVDYAIQIQARFAEARAGGAPPGRAAVSAAGAGGPVIGTACLATMAGFAVFALSPSPLVRSFGFLLVGGIAIAFAVALTAGLAALALSAWRGPGRAAGGRAGSAGGGDTRAPGARRLWRVGSGAVAVAIARPGRVLIAGLVLAVCGWIASAGTEVDTDIRDLAPADLQEMRDVRALEDRTGISGELNVVVQADDLTDPAVIEWMRDFQRRVLERNGFQGKFPDCQRADICPAVSLTDLFAGAAGKQTQQRARSLIDSIPPYFSQAVVTRGPNGQIGDTANISFGIRVQPLDQQQALIDDVRAQIDPPGGSGPPDGVSVRVAGLPVLAAEANQDLSNSRWWLPPAGLLAVALVLVAVWRSLRRALVPLVPVVLATGWSALVVGVMGIPLNPMSATLGALVIAIATEFSVLLSARYESERRSGASVGDALRLTYERTGAAVVASGVTVIAGFAVLAAAGLPLLDDIGLITVAPILRDFGLVTVVDLAVALAGVLLVLPAALVWAEEGFRLPALGRPRRRPAPSAGPVGPGAT